MKLSKVLSPAVKVQLKSVFFFLKRLAKRKKKVITSFQLTEYRTPGVDTFFGYYDLSPFNSKGEVIYLELPERKNIVSVVKNDINCNSRQVVATSSAWNWQQGSRLRWINDDTISFNDFQEGAYFNRIINLRTGEEDKIPFPLYDIDSKYALGLSLDFGRLGKLRPGYGYTCLKEQRSFEEDAPAISIIDLRSKSIIKSLTYREIGTNFTISSNMENCYVNHLSFSPSGERFLFFWIEIVRGYHKASMGVYDMASGIIHPLENNDKVSHYVWIDDDTILCTVYSTPRDCRYFKYEISTSTKKPFCEKCLTQDGHPSLYRGGRILTDTYPDATGYQFLRIVDADTDSFTDLLEIYSVPVTSGERRTDLHPRFNGDKDMISFDANVRGKRSMFLLKKT